LIGVNTTGTADSSFVFNNKAITLLAQSEQVFLSGSVTLGGFALGGSFRLTVGAQAITFVADAKLTVTASAAIYYNQSNPPNNGLALDAGIGSGGSDGSFGVKGVFTAGADLRLKPDTRPASFRAEVAVTNTRPASFRAEVAVTNARLVLLDAVTFTGSDSLTISDAGFRVAGSFSANLFDVATVSASGYFDSDGTFSVTLSGGIDLDASYQPGNRGVNVLNFGGFGYGRLRAFGVTVVGGSVGIRYDGDTGKITADAGVTVAGIDFGTVHLTLGYLKIADGSVPNLGTRNGNTLTLNTGGDGDEAFSVDAVGAGTDAGEKVRVRAFGTTANFDNITSIRAGFGGGNDELRLQSKLGTFRGVSVTATGGAVGLTFLNSSAAAANATGGRGFSVLSSDNAADTLRAGSGDTTLSGGRNQVGGPGTDRFLLNLGTNAPVVTGGGANDALVVNGSSAGESYGVGGTAGMLSVSIGGETVTASGVGKLELDIGGGADTFNAVLARSAVGVLPVTTDSTTAAETFANPSAGGSPWVLDRGTLSANGTPVLTTAQSSKLSATINPGAGGSARVQRVPQPTTVTLSGSAGALTVGGTVGSVVATLDSVLAPLTLVATSPGQTLVLDDTAGDLSFAASRLRTITNTAVTGPTQAGAIPYDPARFSTARANFGPANDRVTLTGATNVVSVNTGDGTNAMTAGGTLSNALAVVGGPGSDTLTLTPGTGTVTLTTGGGTDAAVLDAAAIATNSKGDLTGLVARLDGVPRLTFAAPGGSSLGVKLGAGNNAFDVDTTVFAGDFQVTGGGGNSQFTVRNVPTNLGQFRFQGGAGLDTVTLLMNAPTAGEFAKVLPAWTDSSSTTAATAARSPGPRPGPPSPPTGSTWSTPRGPAASASSAARPTRTA